MLRRTATTMSISPYAMFLIKTKGQPLFRGLSFYQRATKCALTWHRLSPSAKVVLRTAAARHPSLRGPRLRRENAYCAFVRDNYHNVRGSYTQRLTNVAKLYHRKAARK